MPKIFLQACRKISQFDAGGVARIGGECGEPNAVGKHRKTPLARIFAAGKDFKRGAEVFDAIAAHSADALKRCIKDKFAAWDCGQVAGCYAFSVWPASGLEHDDRLDARGCAHSRQKGARMVERIDLQRNDFGLRIFNEKINDFSERNVAFHAA